MEVSDVLSHIEKFINLFPQQQIPSILWSRRGPITNYGFILVARPGNVETANIDVFIDRARSFLAEGIDRLYILGAEENRSFAAQVVNSIEKQVPEFEVIERFDLVNDYRGQEGGFGALLVRRP